MPRIPPYLTGYARELRNGATKQERKVWRLIRHHEPRFTRQHVVGKYILDFACRERKLAVEIDGSQHLERSAEDLERTEVLQSLGWRVIRFWNSEVLENPEGVAEAIIHEVAATRQRTHPRPLPACREGRRSSKPG
jgi:BirA family biotin operon repressor/biotin-[acetyl-CoA-carboxylase] ligase